MKINRYTTEEKLKDIIKSKYKECPECHQDSLDAYGIENKYDEKLDKAIIISFNIICSNCGAVIAKWDGTNRDYYLAKRR